jgi:hypothetical protein
MYAPVNLIDIDTVTARIATDGGGGVLSLRADSPDGPVVAQAKIEHEGSLRLAKGLHPFRIEFFQAGGGAGLVLRMRGGGLDKQGVPAEVLFHGWRVGHAGPEVPRRSGSGGGSESASGGAPPDRGALRPAVTVENAEPGVRVAYYALGPVGEMPKFHELEPFQVETAVTVELAMGEKGFGSSDRRDNVGVVISGYLSIPADGAYTLYLESDDGSRLLLGEEVIINNDGTHAMEEKSSDLFWREVEMPVTDPGGTRELFLVYRPDGKSGGEFKVNWLHFRGRGVTAEGVGGHDEDSEH